MPGKQCEAQPPAARHHPAAESPPSRSYGQVVTAAQGPVVVIVVLAP